MIQLRPMDPAFPLELQLAVEASPLVLVNLFLVAPEDEQALLDAWAEDARWMKARPGFISTQLHRALGASTAYLNYAVWESTDQFREAFSNDEFQAKLSGYPTTTVIAPHLFQTIAVPGVCVA